MFRKCFLILCSGLLLFSTSCDEDDGDDGRFEPNPSNEPIDIVIRPVVDGANFSYDQEYQFGENLVKFSQFAFYISQVSLEDEEGDVHPPQPDDVFLFDSDTAVVFQSDSILSRNYINIDFAIGLSESLNHQDPTLADFPLDQAYMHWGWNPEMGYKFTRFEGKYDSNGDGMISDSDSSFAYHCATDDMFETIEELLDDGDDGDDDIEIEVDVKVVMENIDIAATPEAMGGTPVNLEIINSFTSAVKVSR